MQLQILPEEQIQPTVQTVLAYLDDPANSTPNNILEGIVSAKSLLRGILAGNLVICAIPKPEEGDTPATPPAPPPPRKKAPKKKATRKKTGK